MVLVADVAGTTKANDAYWADKCTVIPSTAIGIVIYMGTVRLNLCANPPLILKFEYTHGLHRLGVRNIFQPHHP